jgi:hypothetical protein
MDASSSRAAAALAEGKTKLILPTSDPKQVLVLSKDSITAGNGLKVRESADSPPTSPTRTTLGDLCGPVRSREIWCGVVVVQSISNLKFPSERCAARAVCAILNGFYT